MAPWRESRRFFPPETSADTEGALSSRGGPKVLSPASLYPRCPACPPRPGQTTIPPLRPSGAGETAFRLFLQPVYPLRRRSNRVGRENYALFPPEGRQPFFRNLCVLGIPAPWLRSQPKSGKERNGATRSISKSESPSFQKWTHSRTRFPRVLPVGALGDACASNAGLHQL